MIVAAVLVFLAIRFAVVANDEANDARYSPRRLAGYCVASVAFLGLALTA